MTDFQLSILDVLTTPDEEFVRKNIIDDETFELIESILGELED